MSNGRRFTDAEKVAYYKKKAAEAGRPQKTFTTSKPVYKKKVYKKKSPGAISALGSVGGALGGNLLGGPVGSQIGKFLGGKLGHLVETITGFGEYKVQQNTLMHGGLSPPQIVNSVDKGGVIIRHREYLGDITSSVGFTVKSYLIQPGLQASFPWLSQIANSYEQYRLRGMIYEFQSTSSDSILSAATSTALGTVVMMTDYDVADAPPTSKRQMLNSEWSCSSKPSGTFIHPIECKKSLSPQNMLYTRGAIAAPDNFDLRLYDFARFNIATEGMQVNGGVIGELWCTYEIELFKSQFSYFGLTDHFRFNTITNGRPLGTVVGSNIGSGGTIGGLISGDGLTYAFPSEISSGKYLFVYSMIGASVINVTAPTPSFINGVGTTYLNNDGLWHIEAPSPTSSGQSTAMVYGTFEVTKQGAYIVFATDGVLPTATNNGDLWVVRLSDSITSKTV